VIIAMVLGMSGGRYDDQQWAPPGVPFEVPDWEGEALIRDHNAIFVAHSAKAPAAVTPAPPAPEPEPLVIPELEQPAELEPESVPESGEETPAENTGPPAPSAPVAAWREYAIAQGANPQEVNGLTKAQLQGVYGGRL
jgi:hypothetical protein